MSKDKLSKDIEDLAGEPLEVRCPDCNHSLELFWINASCEYGSGDSKGEYDVTLPVENCSNCGLQLLNPDGARIKHEGLCRHLGVLAPRQICDIRERANLSRSEFCVLTGIGEASIGRWERGAGIQSPAYDRYLRLLDDPQNMRRLREYEKKDLREPEESEFSNLSNSAYLKQEHKLFQLNNVLYNF